MSRATGFRLASAAASGAALLGAVALNGCAAPEHSNTDKAEPQYVTGSNISRREATQPIKVISGDSLRKQPNVLPDSAPPPEYRTGGR